MAVAKYRIGIIMEIFSQRLQNHIPLFLCKKKKKTVGKEIISAKSTLNSLFFFFSCFAYKPQSKVRKVTCTVAYCKQASDEQNFTRMLKVFDSENCPSNTGCVPIPYHTVILHSIYYSIYFLYTVLQFCSILTGNYAILTNSNQT